MISVVGYLDSIVAAKQNGARFGHSISPNRELVALGQSVRFILVCLEAKFKMSLHRRWKLGFCILPWDFARIWIHHSVRSSLSCLTNTNLSFVSISSRLNGDIGGRTQMASMLCSTFVILAVFFLLPALYYLPRCVLASIVCLVVYSLLAEAPEDIEFYIK